ncbi:MAG: hypothetical protein DRI56_08160 [Chloroflexota bacterium]|nr:MAG: hypothetical protein DRI56_08160 [Chloroflexota bacterium]
MKKQEPQLVLRNLVAEIIIYGILIVGYYFLVLNVLDDWLMSVFKTNLVWYAFIGLGLILAQGVLLDFVTTLLLRYLRVDQFGIRRFLDVFSNR